LLALLPIPIRRAGTWRLHLDNSAMWRIAAARASASSTGRSSP